MFILKLSSSRFLSSNTKRQNVDSSVVHVRCVCKVGLNKVHAKPLYYFFLECDLVPADFVFLLDSSGSETVKGFKTQLAFISNFTANFEVGPNKAQFAAVTFSTGVHKDFYLNEHTDQASVLGAIAKIQYRDGETYTDQGLDFVRNNVLQGIPNN